MLFLHRALCSDPFALCAVYSSHSVQSMMMSSSDSEQDTPAEWLTDQQRYVLIWKELVGREFQVGFGELSEGWSADEANSSKFTFCGGESKSKKSIYCVVEFTLLLDASTLQGCARQVTGSLPEVDAKLYISRTHLERDYVCTVYFQSLSDGNLQLHIAPSDAETPDLLRGVWRLDRQYDSDCINFRRITLSLEKMIEAPRTIISEIIIDETLSEASVAAKNKIADPMSAIPEQVHQRVLREVIRDFQLNDSQQAAASSVFTRCLSLIQGPPGTGKTKTACAILKALSCLRHQCKQTPQPNLV